MESKRKTTSKEQYGTILVNQTCMRNTPISLMDSKRHSHAKKATMQTLFTKEHRQVPPNKYTCI